LISKPRDIALLGGIGEAKQLSERDAEGLFLSAELQRTKDCILDRAKTHGVNDLLVYYLNKRWIILCEKLDIIDAHDNRALLAELLFNHDSHFSDGDSSKFDGLHAELVEKIRGLDEYIKRKERRIDVELENNFDSKTRAAIDTLLDESGFRKDDTIRPSNLLRKVQWTKSDLRFIDAEIIIWRGKLDQKASPADGLCESDFKAYLGLVYRESKLLHTLYELGEQFEQRIAVLRDDRNLKDTNEMWRHEQLQQITSSRASTQRQIDQLHVEVTERKRYFLNCLDAWDVPPASPLREHLKFVTPRMHDQGAAPKEASLVEDRALVMLIGGWWDDSHRNNPRQITPAAWERLGMLMQIRDFDLATFQSTKKEIKGKIDRYNAGQKSEESKIRTWTALIRFVQGISEHQTELRRILCKRFSEIYNTQYLPLMKSRP